MGSRGDVGAGEVAADVHDLAQGLEDALARHLGDVERDRAVLEAAALVDLGLLGARDHVAGGELDLVGRVALHEALAVGVEELGALAPRALGDEEAVLGQRRGVVLDHLHVHQRRADAVGLGDAVAGADERIRRRLVDLARAARGQDHRLGREQLERAGADVARDRAQALAVVVEHERGHEPLLVAREAFVALEQLLVEDVEQGLAGDVGHVVGARLGGAAEGPGAQEPLLVAVEGDPHVLELEDLLRGLAAHDLDGVLVAQVVGALDGVEGVRLPRVLGVQRRVDPARRGVGVRADRMDLGQDRRGGARRRPPHRRLAGRRGRRR